MKIAYIIIFSTFTSIFLVDTLNISLKLRKLLKLNLLKSYTILKPLECVTCSSFWIALITGTMIAEGILGIFIGAMATYLVALLFERLRNL